MLETPNPTLDYWMQFILPYTKNSYSLTNTSGWKYRVDTPDHKIYEKDNIIDYEINTVSEYSSIVTYKYGEYAREVGGLKVYKSLINDNIGNDLTNTAYWYHYVTLFATDSTIYLPVFGEPVEKARILNIEKNNIFNILETIAEKFQVQISFEYDYDAQYQTIGRTIIFNQTIDQDELFSINYGINSDKISRNVDTTDLITKMHVEPLDSEFEEISGLLTIQNAPQNLAMENFLYNFDYLKDIGEITQDQYHMMVGLQYVLRMENIQYSKETINYLILDNQYQQILTDLEFIKYQLPAIQKTIDRLTKESTDYSTTDQPIQITDKLYLVVQEDDGTYSVNVSSQRGAIAGTFTIKTLAST